MVCPTMQTILPPPKFYKPWLAPFYKILKETQVNEVLITISTILLLKIQHLQFGTLHIKGLSYL